MIKRFSGRRMKNVDPTDQPSTSASAIPTIVPEEDGQNASDGDVPDWIKELRRGWEEEIKTNMPEEKQRYFSQFDAEEHNRIKQHMRTYITSVSIRDFSSNNDNTHNGSFYTSGNRLTSTAALMGDFSSLSMGTTPTSPTPLHVDLTVDSPKTSSASRGFFNVTNNNTTSNIRKSRHDSHISFDDDNNNNGNENRPIINIPNRPSSPRIDVPKQVNNDSWRRSASSSAHQPPSPCSNEQLVENQGGWLHITIDENSNATVNNSHSPYAAHAAGLEVDIKNAVSSTTFFNALNPKPFAHFAEKQQQDSSVASSLDSSAACSSGRSSIDADTELSKEIGRMSFDGVELPTASQMVEEKAKPTRRRNIFARMFSYAPRKKNEMELRAELEEYEIRLNTFLHESKLVLNELRLNEVALRRDIRSEMETLRRCSLNQLIPIFRSLSQTKLLRLQARQKLEARCKAVIKDRIYLTQKALSQDELPNFVGEAFFKDVDDLLACHPELAFRWKVIKALDKRANQLADAYLIVRKNSKPCSKKERSSVLQALIQEMGTPYDDKQQFVDTVIDSHQDSFSRLVSDQRISEGQSIQTFLNELNTYGFEKVPPREINGYVDSFVSFLGKMHHIPKGSLPKLQMVATRHIYSLVGPALFDIEVRRNLENDDRFRKQVKHLRKLSPVELGVEPKYLPEFVVKDNRGRILDPYHEAIEILDYFGLLLAPMDMIHCVYSASKKINDIARINCTQHGITWMPMGADEFFPILVYTVVNSQLYTAYANIRYVMKYGQSHRYREDAGVEPSEVEYYLTSLECAIQYISELTEEQIDSFRTKCNSMDSHSSSSTVVTEVANSAGSSTTEPNIASPRDRSSTSSIDEHTRSELSATLHDAANGNNNNGSSGNGNNTAAHNVSTTNNNNNNNNNLDLDQYTTPSSVSSSSSSSSSSLSSASATPTTTMAAFSASSPPFFFCDEDDPMMLSSSADRFRRRSPSTDLVFKESAVPRRKKSAATAANKKQNNNNNNTATTITTSNSNSNSDELVAVPLTDNPLMADGDDE